MVAEVEAISISSSTNVTIQDSYTYQVAISILNATNVSIVNLTILNAEVCTYSI
jgi:hypothetical protein